MRSTSPDERFLGVLPHPKASNSATAGLHLRVPGSVFLTAWAPPTPPVTVLQLPEVVRQRLPVYGDSGNADRAQVKFGIPSGPTRTSAWRVTDPTGYRTDFSDQLGHPRLPVSHVFGASVSDRTVGDYAKLDFWRLDAPLGIRRRRLYARA